MEECSIMIKEMEATPPRSERILCHTTAILFWQMSHKSIWTNSRKWWTALLGLSVGHPSVIISLLLLLLYTGCLSLPESITRLPPSASMSSLVLLLHTSVIFSNCTLHPDLFVLLLTLVFFEFRTGKEKPMDRDLFHMLLLSFGISCLTLFATLTLCRHSKQISKPTSFLSRITRNTEYLCGCFRLRVCVRVI